MKFKVVGKSLILTDHSHKITEGENSFDTVEIAVPNSHDDCDLSALSFRFSKISENGEQSAVQILRHTKCDEKYIYLKGTITSDFSSITGKVTFMLTGINGENVVAKFQSAAYTISNDISLMSLPNETAAEQLFNQTQLEVQKAVEAAERAEKASQTPAPAEIYSAAEERLGGVLSGNDISVDSNGIVTVKSINGKIPENEIANIKSAQNLIADLSIQVAHPNNFLIYDDVGKPSVMVAIPKFYLDEVIDGASHTLHPAFIINGVEQDIIYISKYQNIVENGRAYSLPMTPSTVSVTFDQAYNYCKAKGAGWHLMTNAEWAAIALWCKKNGTMPKGNNNYGKDISETDLPQKAIAASKGSTSRILTGSGRESWYHDRTFSGIADLNGNVWEWQNGLRLNNGEIQIIADNNAAFNGTDISAASAQWKAINSAGQLVAPGTTGTLKYKSGTIATDAGANGSFTFESIKAANGITIPDLMKALALAPNGTGYESDTVWINAGGEKIPTRGGESE